MTEATIDARRDVAALLEQTLEHLAHFVMLIRPEWERRRPGDDVRGLPNTTPDVCFVLAHLVGYEERLAQPVLADMLQDRDGSGVVESGHVSWFRPYVDELAELPAADLLRRLRAIRAEHVATVRAFSPGQFHKPLTPLWNVEPDRPESAAWLATKTAQHTIEHCNQVARMALFGV